MTIKELIEVLQYCDADAPITFLSSDGEVTPIEDKMVYHELDSNTGKWYLIITPVPVYNADSIIRAILNPKGQ